MGFLAVRLNSRRRPSHSLVSIHPFQTPERIDRAEFFKHSSAQILEVLDIRCFGNRAQHQLGRFPVLGFHALPLDRGSGNLSGGHLPCPYYRCRDSDICFGPKKRRSHSTIQKSIRHRISREFGILSCGCPANSEHEGSSALPHYEFSFGMGLAVTDGPGYALGSKIFNGNLDSAAYYFRRLFGLHPPQSRRPSGRLWNCLPISTQIIGIKLSSFLPAKSSSRKRSKPISSPSKSWV